MKPELELQTIRREQQSLQLMMFRLDDRIEQVAAALEAGARQAEAAPKPPSEPMRPRAEETPPKKPESYSWKCPSPLPPPPMEVKKPEAAPVESAAVLLEAAETIHEPEGKSLEIQLGRVWLVRIGIVILLTGLVFLGNLAYHRIVPLLGPAAKLALLAGAGGALCVIGTRLERGREAMRNYARVLTAGGCATLYYTAYAAHFVQALRVIDSPIAGGLLLLALAGGIVWFAERRKSEPLALLAVLLSYYVSGINQVGWFSLCSSLLLTAVAVFLLVRHRWVRLSYVSLVGTYASFAWWRFYHLAYEPALPQMDIFGRLWQSGTPQLVLVPHLFFLVGYWLIFTVGAFSMARHRADGARSLPLMTSNNAAFFALAAHEYFSAGSGYFWLFSLVFGGVLMGLSALAQRPLRDAALAPTLLAQGLALFTTGLALRLTGHQLTLAMAAQSLVLFAGARRQALVPLVGSLVSISGAAVLAAGGLLVREPGMELTAALVAGVLAFKAWWWKRRWSVPAEIPSVPFVMLYGAFALGTFDLWCCQGSAGSIPWIAAGAVLSTALAIALRFREIARVGQGLLPLAVWLWWGLPRAGALVPGSIVVAGLGLALWWSRQGQRKGYEKEPAVMELTAAFSAAFAGFLWLARAGAPAAHLALGAAVGVAWLGLGMLARARMVGISSVLFTLLSVAGFLAKSDRVSWEVALCPIFGLFAIAGLMRWADRLGGEVQRMSAHVRNVALGAGWVLLLPWVFQHIPPAWQAPLFLAAGAGVVLASVWQQALAPSGLALGALGCLLMAIVDRNPSVQNLLGCVLLASCCRVTRGRTKDPLLLTAAPAQAWVTTGLLTLWVLRANQEYGWDIHLTVLWALLAPAWFAAGFLLRERAYRHAGLVLLALCIGNLFIKDVWAFNAATRIVSFIVVGVVLLLVGYFYNRFEERLRRWL